MNNNYNNQNDNSVFVKAQLRTSKKDGSQYVGISLYEESIPYGGHPSSLLQISFTKAFRGALQSYGLDLNMVLNQMIANNQYGKPAIAVAKRVGLPARQQNNGGGNYQQQQGGFQGNGQMQQVGQQQMQVQQPMQQQQQGGSPQQQGSFPQNQMQQQQQGGFPQMSLDDIPF